MSSIFSPICPILEFLQWKPKTQKQELLGTTCTKSQGGGTREEWSVLREQGVQMPQREQDENNHHQMLENLASCSLWSRSSPTSLPPAPPPSNGSVSSPCLTTRSSLSSLPLHPPVRLWAQSKNDSSPFGLHRLLGIDDYSDTLEPMRSCECSSRARRREEPALSLRYRVLKQIACWNLQSCSLTRGMRDIFNGGFICLSFFVRIKPLLGSRTSRKYT